MAEQLCAKGHDVRAVSASPEFTGLPDEEILIGAIEAGRSLVTANIKDFMPLDARYRAANRSHAGLILVSTKTFPQNRAFVSAVTNALLAAEAGPAGALNQSRLASSTAMMPVMKTPSKVPAPPIDTTGAPSRLTFGRLTRSAPSSVPSVPPA